MNSRTNMMSTIALPSNHVECKAEPTEPHKRHVQTYVWNESSDDRDVVKVSDC
jgi:hypothetical protein